MPWDELSGRTCSDIEQILGSLNLVVTLKFELSHLTSRGFHTPPYHLLRRLHSRLLTSFDLRPTEMCGVELNTLLLAYRTNLEEFNRVIANNRLERRADTHEYIDDGVSNTFVSALQDEQASGFELHDKYINVPPMTVVKDKNILILGSL